MNHLLAWLASLVQRHRHTGLDGSQVLGPDSFPGGALPSGNLLINGGFEIWQRGWNFTNVQNNAVTVDCWKFHKGGSSTLNVDRETAVVDRSEVAAKLTYTHNVTSALYQLIEKPLNFQGRQLALSVRVSTSTPNAVRVRIADSSGPGDPSPFHPGDGAYRTLTAVKTIANNASAVAADIVLEASATIYVDNAMLVVGPSPSEFVPKRFPDEATGVLRYCEVIGADNAWQRFGVGNCYASNKAAVMHQYSQRKRPTPTITVSAAGTFAIFSGGSIFAATSITPSSTSRHATDLDVTISGTLSIGNAAILIANNTLSARMTIEADL